MDLRETNSDCLRQASKPEVRRWIDQVGEVYSKAVVAATLAALVILPLTGVPLLSTAGQRGAVYRAMGLLTTASPCALVLVPLAYVSAIAAITSRRASLKRVHREHLASFLRALVAGVFFC